MIEDTNTSVRFFARVDGHVQGVGFRYFVREQGEALKVVGWVRNTHDGFVEITAEGPRPMLEELLTRVHKGPRGSFVTEVKVQWLAATGEFSSFDVGYTV